MNDEAVYRTAPATPGMLIIFVVVHCSQEVTILRVFFKPSGKIFSITEWIQGLLVFLAT